jgi:hypothetical protein
LAAQECVPAEAPGVGQAGHPGGQGQVAQPQHRVGLGVALLPGLYLRLVGDPDQRVMERGEIAVDDDAFAARVPEMDLGPGLRGTLGGGRQGQFRARLLVHLQREDLAKTQDAVAGVKHGIAAHLQLQGVQRGLEGEAPPVDRGGERKNGRLDVPAHRTEAVQQPDQALGGLAVDDAAIVGALLRIHPIQGVAKAVAPDAGNPGRIRNLGPLNGDGSRLRRR